MIELTGRNREVLLRDAEEGGGQVSRYFSVLENSVWEATGVACRARFFAILGKTEAAYDRNSIRWLLGNSDLGLEVGFEENQRLVDWLVR